jgi:hypothetical protein
VSGPSPRVSIIVISYNTRTETLDCLASVEKETASLAYELIVVDNNSPDGSAEAIARAFPAAQLHALKDNLGFARANNLAALEARGEYLLLLNPDTVVLDHAIERLVAFADARPRAGIWGGRTLFGDLRLDPTSAWRRMTPWSLFCRAAGLSGAFPRSGLFNGEEMPHWDRGSEREVDIVTGCFLLIRRDLWQRLGGFDPVFFMYGEEADLCLRARELGARPLITPAATIIHLGGISEATRAGKMIKLLAAKVSLAKRYFSPPGLLAARVSVRLWSWSRWVGNELLLKLRPSDRRRHERDQWREVWRARETWRNGFPEREPARPAAAPTALMPR